MLEEYILQLLILSFIANIVLTFISLALIVMFVIITYKENHISANH